MFEWLVFYIGCLLFAVAPVLTCIRIRDIIKIHRQGLIEELAEFFKPLPRKNQATADPNTDEDEEIVHSFEFVKLKYYVEGTLFGKRVKDFSFFDWLVAAFFLVALTTFLNIVAVTALAELIGLNTDATLLPDDLGLKAFLKSQTSWSAVFLAAYAGSYVFMIRAFLQAVNNFDLTPVSIYGAMVNLVLGIIMPQILFFGAKVAVAIVSLSAPVADAGLAGAILASFVAGFMPEAVLRETFRRSNLTTFKRENAGIYHQFVSTPIEVVDGIDSQIRDRLNDFHIKTVQNLAAANPIMLFIETPFGIYALIDWVAQAQLCASVGAEALAKLWALGVRTIFDLERLIQPSCEGMEATLIAVGDILLPALGTARPQIQPSAVAANIRMRISNCHVQRLRQIVNRVEEKLGDRNRNLPPWSRCPSKTDDCLFRSSLKTRKVNSERAAA